jgi:hypothetical protein
MRAGEGDLLFGRVRAEVEERPTSAARRRGPKRKCMLGRCIPGEAGEAVVKEGRQVDESVQSSLQYREGEAYMFTDRAKRFDLIVWGS